MAQLLPLLIWALVPSALGLMNFLGFPSPNTAVCGQPYSLQLTSSFAQVCSQSSNCPVVQWSISPTLTQYGLNLNPTTGTLSGTISPNAPAQILTTVTASDSASPGGTATGNFQLVVSCPPTFSGQIPDQNAKSQTPFTLNLGNYFTMSSNADLTWSVEGNSATVTGALIGADGILRWTPNGTDAYFSPYRIRVVATSGTTRTPSNYFNVFIAPAGVQPLGTIPSQTATEGVAFSGSYSVYFRDPDQYTLSYSLKVDGASLNTATTGMVFNAQSGFLSGTPTTAFVGTHTLVVCANNNQGQSDVCQSPTSLTVAPRAKQAPVCGAITPLTGQTTQTVSIDLATVCRDPLGQLLTYTLQQGSLPAGSGLSLTGSNLIGTFTNADAAASPLRLVFTVTNTDQLSTTLTLQITLTVRNNAPVTTALAGQAQTAYTLKSFSYSVKSWFADQDIGDTLTYSITPNLPASSGLRFYNGDFSGTPNDSDLAQQTYSFTVTATDSKGLSASSFLYITVLKGNHPPTTIPLTGMPRAVLGSPWQWNISPFFSDQDGDRLTYTLTGQPMGSGLVAVSSDGILRGTFTNADSANSPVTVTVTADDQKGGTVTNTFTYSVIVPPQCTTPLSSDVPLAYVGTFWNFTVSRYCVSNGRTLTYSLQQLFAGNTFVIDSSTGVISGTISQADFNKGSFPVTYTVSDGAGGITNNTFTVFVVKSPAPIVMDCPAPSICYAGYNCGQQASTCFNGQGQTLIYSMTGQPAGSLLTIDRYTGVISGQVTAVDAAASQPIHLIITADNQKGGVSTKDLYYTVQFPQPVTLKAVPPSGFPDLICGMTCCAWNPRDYVNNPGGGPVNYTLTSQFPMGSQLRLLPNGVLAGVASAVDVRASPISVVIAVSNNMPAPPVQFTASFNVIGTPAPQTIPGKTIPTSTVKVGVPWSFDASSYFNIPAGISARYSMSGAPNSLLIDANSGVITGTLGDSDAARTTYTLIVTADDTNTCGGGSLSISFPINVDANNKSPVVTLPPNAAPLQACEGADFKVCVCDWFSDPKNLRLTYNISGLVKNTKLVFVPSTGLLSGRTGPDDTDGTGSTITVCATNTVGLTTCVTRQVSFDRGQRPPIADPPIPSPVTATTGQRFVGYFNFHFYDSDGQPLIYSVAGLPPGSGLGIGPITGIFSGTPNEADFRASPLVLSVFASNEQNVPVTGRCLGNAGRARSDFIVIVEKQVGPPLCQTIPPAQSVVQTGQFYVLDVSRYFLIGEGATKLEYALRGLPRGSGLSIDPRSGVISGIISQSDTASRPLSFFVAATNGYGQCQSQVVVASVPPPPPQRCPVIAQSIPNQNAMANQYFSVDLSNFFQSNQRLPLTYSVNGFPQGSGFSFNTQTGVLSGTSSFSDINVGTIPVVTTVSCGPGFQPITYQWNLVVSTCRGCQNNGGCAQRCIIQDPVSCRPVCSCDHGILAPDGRSCLTGNACDMNNGGCEKICTVVNGAPVCSCPDNWNLAPDGRGCQYNACGSNNGGCEQLCIAVGQSLKCDCRSGTLQPDGRSCSAALMTVGTVPPALVIGCQYFVFDFSTVVKYTGRGTLSFLMTGVPPSSGFSISSGGLLSGTPSLADCATAQPMTLTITATDGTTKVSAVMFMSAFCDKPAVCQQKLPGLPAPTATGASPAPSIPLLWAVVCLEFKFDVTPYFQNIQSPAQYSALGLASGSGLQMRNGLLTGTPTVADCSTAPMMLTVVCTDAAGRQTKSIITVKFMSCDCSSSKPALPLTSSTTLLSTTRMPAPVVQALPAPAMSITRMPIAPAAPAAPAALYSHTTCRCGQPFFYDTSSMFASQFQVNSLRYNIAGLPSNSGLVMSDSGVLSGAPNANILQSNPLRAQVTGTDPYGKTAQLVLTIGVSGDCDKLAPQIQSATLTNARTSLARPATDGNEGIVPIQTAHVGVPFLLNVSRIAFCATCDGSQIEYRTDLPASSGFKFTNGALTGSPVATDCSQSQPLAVGITVWQRGVQKANTKVLISSVCDNSTASNPVLSGSLPQATAVLSSLFYYDAAPLMSGSSSLNFSVFGIAANSDLKMSSAGVLSGIASAADVNGPPLLITATDATGDFVQATLKLTVSKNGAASNIIFLPLKPVQALKGQFFQLNIAQRFYDVTGRKLNVSLSGLARGSGMTFDSKSGVLSGTPNDIDLQQYQPIRFIVSARVANETKQGEVYVNCLSGQASQNNTGIVPADLDRAPVSTPLQRQVATEGEPFLMGVSSAFFDQDGDILTYSLEDLPEGTGLRIDPVSGIISGTPTRSDSLALQPLNIVVAATDPNGLAIAETFLLTVFQGARRTVNRAPVASQIDNVVAALNKSFSVSLAGSFADADGDVLTYSVSGLPKATGCRISNSGALEGTPTSADLAASPMTLVVSVSDGVAQVQSSFNLTVIDNKGQNRPPTSTTMPQLRLARGDSLRFAAKQYFTDPDGLRLTFQVVGLPKGTGFSLDPTTGVLSGFPSASDFAAKQPIVAGFVASDGQGGRAGEVLYIRLDEAGYRSIEESDFDLDGISQSVVQAGVPEVTCEVGTWVLFNARQYFPSYGDSGLSITYSIRGLPVGSGLQIDAASGVVSGTANAVDASAAQSQPGKALPITITCTFKMGNTSNPVDQVILLKFDSDDGRNHAPLAQTIPPASLRSSGDVLVNAWSSFSDPDGDDLTFSVLGLPTGTGLSMIPTSGVLFGTPSAADLAALQPLVLTIVCDDSHGGKVQEALILDLSKTVSVNASTTKTCEQLGWPVSSRSTGCSRSPKVGGICPSKLSYNAASVMCSALGARLCSSQELLDRNVQDSSECNFDLLWTSSTCAFGDEVLVQGRRSSTGRECQNKTAPVAQVACCADSHPLKTVVPTIATGIMTVAVSLAPLANITKSSKSCAELQGFTVNPLATQHSVCSSAKSKGKCATAATFDQARTTCQGLGARLCTSDELQQHLATEGGCLLDNKRVWSSSSCPGNQVLTRAGSPENLLKFPQQCTSVLEKLPYHCCADFKQGEAFDNLQVAPGKRSAQISWTYGSYSFSRLSYQKIGTDGSVDPTDWLGSKELISPVGTKFQAILADLQPGTRYMIRVMPVQKVRSQVTEIKGYAVEFLLNTASDVA